MHIIVHLSIFYWLYRVNKWGQSLNILVVNSGKLSQISSSAVLLWELSTVLKRQRFRVPSFSSISTGQSLHSTWQQALRSNTALTLEVSSLIKRQMDIQARGPKQQHGKELNRWLCSHSIIQSLSQKDNKLRRRWQADELGPRAGTVDIYGEQKEIMLKGKLHQSYSHICSILQLDNWFNKTPHPPPPAPPPASCVVT